MKKEFHEQMNVCYDSPMYMVLHMDANEGVHATPRHVFEIIDKHSQREVVVTDALGEMFQRQIQFWREDNTSEEQLQEALCGWLQLGQLNLTRRH